MNEAETVSSPVSSIEPPPRPAWADELGVGTGTAEEAEAQAEAPEVVLLTQEDFHRLFCGGFQTASAFTGLQSLHVDEHDGKAAAATKAMYDTIMDIPALHFLLKPQNKWLDRTLAIGMFTLPMVHNVKAELAVRAEAAKQAQKAKQKPKDDKSQQDPPNGELKLFDPSTVKENP